MVHRNRWFTELKNGGSFHGYVSHNQMVSDTPSIATVYCQYLPSETLSWTPFSPSATLLVVTIPPEMMIPFGGQFLWAAVHQLCQRTLAADVGKPRKNGRFLHILWLVLWNMFFIFPFSWECHHPNWLTPSFFRWVGQPPTSSARHFWNWIVVSPADHC